MNSATTIEVKTGFFPLAFFLFLCRPRIIIDELAAETRSWGTHSFSVSPGQHRVKVYFRYLFKEFCGANERTFDVAEGEVVKVKFYMWPWMLAPGSMKVLPGVAQLPEARLRP